jgi:two-component system, LuxR family, response regulator FixJ
MTIEDANIVNVIDDDPSVRRALSGLLSTKGYRARAFESARSFLAAVTPDECGCVLTDVRMPEMTGVELMHVMKKSQISLPVIVMTAYADVPLAIEVMKAGAQDVLEKPFTDEALIAAIDAAMCWGDARRARDASIREARTRLATLTPREQDVLQGLLEGKPNKIIAFNLGIGIRTVETHRATIMEKMNADSLSELVRLAMMAQGDAA